MNPSIRKSTPSVAISTAVVFCLVGAWCGARLYLVQESVLPLTFVIPLLICVWTRQRWQLWTMTLIFSVMAGLKIFWILPEHTHPVLTDWILFGATLFNIVIGAFLVEAIMALRDRMETRNATISAQNAELEAQAEELSQQNDEIRAQTEELAQQNEEIASQAEELERQNQELHESNGRLRNRESILQTLVHPTRSPQARQKALDEVCQQALGIIGDPIHAVAVMELNGELFNLRAQAAREGGDPLPSCWPLAGSLLAVVLKEKKTAYVDDLSQRPDLAAPFVNQPHAASLLATPIYIDGLAVGAVAVVSRQTTHWTQEQFRVVEWLAAQCGMLLESLRWADALRRRTEEVEAANRAKDQFLAMLSHELRTPLTPVLAAAGALEKDGRLPQDVKDDLSMMRRNVAVQSRLIDDLLDLTRIGRGKFDLDLRPLEIAEIVRQSAGIVAGDLDAKDQTLSMQWDLPANALVIGDAARLQQVFWNLLKNAVKFTPVRGRIEMHATMLNGEKPMVRIKVTDNGTGISPKDIERIFLPFEQAAQLRRGGMGAGLGLGLSIARAIVQSHDGTIGAVSDGVDHGATFVVELPLANHLDTASLPNISSRDPDESKSVLAGGSALRILLVEDHQDTGRLLSRLLRNSGHTVMHAENSNSALKFFGENHFDLVISDLGLPDGSGLDLMREIRTRRNDLPGICLSGFGMESDVQASREAGFAEHLTKPIDFQRLQNVIGRIVSMGAGAV